MSATKVRNSHLSTKVLIGMSILAAMSAVLMLFRFPLPFAPSFMDVDFADVPVLIGGFAYGPIAGLGIGILKNVIKLILSGTTTGYIGELSNIIVTSTYVLVSATIYHYMKTRRGATIALILGVLSMTLVATLSNAYLIFPLFERVVKFPISRILSLTMEKNSMVNSYWTMMFFAVVPFNLVKAGLNAILTSLLYKSLTKYLK